MPKDTRIDELIAHFEKQRQEHGFQIEKLDHEKRYHHTYFDAYTKVLDELRGTSGTQAGPEPAPPAPDKPKRQRTAKQGDLKGLVEGDSPKSLTMTIAEVTDWYAACSIPDAANFNGTIDSNFGLMWDNRGNWQPADWRNALSVIKSKK